jgi:regulatory protein
VASRKSTRVPAADQFEQAAIRYLARRDRTAAQVHAYLSRRGAPLTRIRALIGQLQARGYLNDDAYAERWARARIARRPMGRERLSAELEAQGVSLRAVARTLELIYGERSERELARDLLSRQPALRRPGDSARSAGVLRRHGFSEDTIEAVLGTGGEPEAIASNSEP